MLKRKIYKNLLNWKKTKENECLLVKGARQVGKTFIIDYFGKNEYKSYIYINFFLHPEYINIFKGSLEPSEIYKRITLYIKDVKLIEKNTLIFLDEIQHAPEARTALKFLAIDNKYDIIASGSLLGLHYKEISSIPVGYENQIEMFPLDFEEFLWANGINEEAINLLKELFEKKERIDDTINKKYLSIFNDYIVVGGMPNIINKFLKTNSYIEAHNEQEKIIKEYKDDISKYAENNMKQKIFKLFDSIPLQLAKEYTKFQYKTIEPQGSSRKYEDSIEWLIDAGIIKKCYNVSTPKIPLIGYIQLQNFKIYMIDTGLLTCMYGLETQKTLIKNGLKTSAKGGIYENVVFENLIKNNQKTYYYKNEKNTQEIEFLLEQDNDVVPIEVKSMKGKTISLNNFIDFYKPHIAYKIANSNIGIDGTKFTIPYYMLPFITKQNN